MSNIAARLKREILGVIPTVAFFFVVVGTLEAMATEVAGRHDRADGVLIAGQYRLAGIGAARSNFETEMSISWITRIITDAYGQSASPG